MFFKRCLVTLLPMLLAPLSLNADDFVTNGELNILQLSPNKCVALRKGRECFASIQVKWNAKKVGDYCLRRQADNLTINCWQGQKQGEFVYIFRAAQKENLQLVIKETQHIISNAEIKVSWVYKSKRKKARWRVF